MNVDYKPADVQKVLQSIQDVGKAQQQAQQDLLRLQISNAEYLAKLQIEQINKQAAYKLKQEQAINERLIKMGIDAAAVIEKRTLAERIKALDEEEKAALKGARGKAAKDKIKAEYVEKRKAEAEFQKEIDKAEQAREKEKEKRDKKAAENLYKENLKHFDNLGNALFSPKKFKEAVKDLTEYYMSEEGGGLSEADATTKATETAKKNRRVAAGAAVEQALANFAKQLEGTLSDIANARSEIDTRLWGSSNRRVMGSYWEGMSLDIVQKVGMNPFVKQSDVTASLKNLVGQGIAFNVEQRAFLDTVSAKIANTFEATDATLLQLVRIQQADTTAARLGMEAALTSFLNSMYETTEYMQSAAADIRQSIYEASALMGAAEATAFEYQVQKWMGSLYSVGFGNTSGLASALGKLAAGDVSGITEGGFGNLLVMAANRSNLSIAEILANGLDESDTNKLMQAMVEYLQDIYAETKNSRVVAQQYASVFGLTASDLKAAANLYGSTNSIGKNRLSYTGMLGNLQTMANSMAVRTSTGEMMENLFGNLKYATANTMANNPIMYALYSIAGILRDTTGGIAIPSIMAMGSGFDLETTVADLMQTGVMAAGLLGGIGSMFAGLAKGNGFNILSNFGITGTGLKVLSRGTGTGIAAITSSSVSESGFVGNSDSSDIQNATMQSANEEGGNKVAEAQEDSNETKLKTVDEHIVQIYELLDSVVLGTRSLKVDMGDVTAWSSAMGRLGQ